MPQYTWLEDEFPKVNIAETPWFVLNHSSWHSIYDYHYMEGETMRVMYEAWFVSYKVDVSQVMSTHAKDQ